MSICVSEKNPKQYHHEKSSRYLRLCTNKFKKSETPREHLIQQFYTMQETYRGSTEFYTDGSKTHEHVGCGAIGIERVKSMHGITLQSSLLNSSRYTQR